MRIATINDQQQRDQALNPRQSFIVQAPAGSGKTELLIQRYLLLLAKVNSPEEILAITFTKKAANEMRERILHALKQALQPQPQETHKQLTWKLAKDALERDKERSWNLLTNPNQLRIQTIDSLCSFLTRQLPLLSNFGSQPALADKPNFLYEETVKEVLLHVEEDLDWSQSIARLLLHLDNDLNKLHNLLISLLKKRDQWLPHILNTHNTEDIRFKLESNLAQIRDEYITQLKIMLPAELADELVAVAEFCASNLSETLENNNEWLFYNKILLTTDGSWRKALRADGGFPALATLKNPAEKTLHNQYRQRMKALLAGLEEHECFREALAKLAELPDAQISEEQWGILQDLIYILKIATAQLRVVFQQYGQIDFIENALAALTALGTHDHPTDLALALDYKIQHLLVDEFQDTSSTQYYLLEKLTLGWTGEDGRTLFVVGDPMQSIYRFREAEVGLFIRMRERGIGNIKLIPLTLTRNFRSTNQIVQWNNNCFCNIFPKYADISSGAVPYSPSFANQNENDPYSTIDIAGFAKSPQNPDASGIIEKKQAQHLVKVINTTKQHYPSESIAILVRSRAHLLSLVPVFKSANINFRAVEIDPLVASQIIQDLFSLTCALLHPYDRIAWLAILRAPWCGLLLADLLILTNNDAKNSIWQQLNNSRILDRLSDDAKQRLARIKPILSNCLAERNRLPLRHFIENTWRMIGGPACLANIEELNNANVYFELLNKATDHGNQLNIDDLRKKLNDLFAPCSEDESAVQIMTIHSAKGLEFDTVILPHLEKTAPNEKKALLLWMEQPLENNNIALLLAPISAKNEKDNKLYKYIANQQKIKLQHEADRLLYVATTRTKKRLYLSFLANPESKPTKGSFLEKIQPFVNEGTIQIKDEIESPLLLNTSRSISRLSISWKNPVINKFDYSSIHQSYAGFYLINNDARFIGTAIHAILQQLCKHGLDWWTNHSNKNNFLKNILQQLSITNNNLITAIKTVNQAIENTLKDKRGQWILSPHQDAQSELAISSIIDGKIENLIIDRTFVDQHNIRWIIDYKSSMFTEGDLETFLMKEKDKYLTQMEKYKQAMQHLDQRTIRFGLYFPALSAWKEWG